MEHLHIAVQGKIHWQMDFAGTKDFGNLAWGMLFEILPKNDTFHAKEKFSKKFEKNVTKFMEENLSLNS